jgi:hypothetical protein
MQYRCASDYLLPGWQALRQQAMERAEGVCEFCGYGIACFDLHHRWYPRKAADNLRLLMAIHRECHDAIHHGGTLKYKAGSLMANGDKGIGNTPQWRAYLRSKHP